MVTTEVTIITERVSTSARPMFVTTAGTVSGNRIPNSTRCGSVLNECEVLTRLVGIRPTFRTARWTTGGRVKTTAIIMFGMPLTLNSTMTGIRQINVGAARTVLSSG